MNEAANVVHIRAETVPALLVALRAKAVGHPAALARLGILEYKLRAAAAPEDDASVELRQLAMWELERFEKLLREG